MKSKITCFGQNTVKIETNGKIMYFDPTIADKKADLVLYSGFEKGFNLEVLKKIKKKTTKIIAPIIFREEILKVITEENLEITEKSFKLNDDIKINIVPAYIVDKILNEDYKTFNGYSISAGKEIIYIAGPTGVIPEMNLIEANITILPVAGPFMDLFEALAATNVIKSDVFIPISYSDDEEEGLLSCTRFTKKCMQETMLCRKEKLPEPKYLV